MRTLIAVAAAAVTTLSGCTVISVVTHYTSDSPDAPPLSLTEEIAPPARIEEPIIEVPMRFSPDMSAEEARPVMEAVLGAAFAGDGRIDRERALEALVSAGFPEGTIESTDENSQVKLPVDSLSVAVAINGECVVGQFSKTWLVVEVESMFDDGSCLIAAP